MEVGKYSKKKIDFSKFECQKFPLTLFDPAIFGLAGCGYNLLASIVGKESPFDIRKLNKSKNKESCEDKFILWYLRKHGFKVLPLTKCNLTNTKSVYLDGVVKPYNVFISSNLVRKNEASWFINYQHYMLHNQEILPVKSLDFLNFPIMSAFLIWHKKYK